MQLTDEERKVLTEYIGECWHEYTVIDGVRHCSCGVWGNIVTIFSHKGNRTFTTPADLHAVYSAIVGRWEWAVFFSYMMCEYERVCHNWQEGYDYEYAAWLSCLDHPEHIPERMKLAADWIKTTNPKKGEKV